MMQHMRRCTPGNRESMNSSTRATRVRKKVTLGVSKGTKCKCSLITKLNHMRHRPDLIELKISVQVAAIVVLFPVRQYRSITRGTDGFK